MLTVDHWAHFQDSDEKNKIIKPWWDGASDYIGKALLMVAVLSGVLQATMKSFVCLPVVECHRNSSALNTSKFCAGVFKDASNATHVKMLLVKLNDRRHYDFVESNCGRMQESGKKETLWPVCLFFEVIAIIIIGNLWLKFPSISPIIDVFTSLVIECRDTQGTVEALQNVLWKKTENPDLDHSEVIKAKTLNQKVLQFREDIKDNHFIYNTYLYGHGVCRSLILLGFIAINAKFFSPTTYELICRMDDAIFKDYSYFKCENGLHLYHYLTFVISTVLLVIYVFFAFCSFAWSVKIRGKEDKLKLDKNNPGKTKEVEKGDLAFMLHLLHRSNIMFFTRIVLFLSYSENTTVKYQIYPAGRFERVVQQCRHCFSRRNRKKTKDEENQLAPAAGNG